MTDQELYSEFLSNKIDFHCSPREVLRRYAFMQAPLRGQFRRYILGIPKDKQESESITDYETRKLITKVIRRIPNL